MCRFRFRVHFPSLSRERVRVRAVATSDVVSRKYVYTSRLSFFACLVENPDALKIENQGFFT
jgi:hypothetical protein